MGRASHVPRVGDGMARDNPGGSSSPRGTPPAVPRSTDWTHGKEWARRGSRNGSCPVSPRSHVARSGYSWSFSPPSAVRIARSLTGSKPSGSVRTAPSAETTLAPPSLLPSPPTRSVVDPVAHSVESEVSRLHPRELPVRDLDDHQRVLCAVRQVLVRQRLGSPPCRLRSDHRHEAGRADLIRLQPGSQVDPPHLVRQLAVVRTVPGLGEVVGVVKLPLLQERQEKDPPAMHRLAVAVGDIGWREAAESLVVVGDRQRDLLEVSGGLRRSGGISSHLDGGCQPSSPDPHDGDNHDSRDQPPRMPSTRQIRRSCGFHDGTSSIERCGSPPPYHNARGG